MYDSYAKVNKQGYSDVLESKAFTTFNQHALGV